ATTEIYTLSLHDALPILRSTAASSLPNRTLVAISHADAALTITVLFLCAIARRADAGKEESSVSHQSRACVSRSKRIRRYSQPSSSSGGKGSKNSGLMWIFPLRAPGLR